MPHELRHVTLSLPPAESHQLLEVLEERRKDLCADGARRGLDSLYEKVADAVELAAAVDMSFAAHEVRA